MVGGVCGGLGRYFDVNPAFYRVGFVILALLGGAGILIYFAALLVMPNDGESETTATEILRNHSNNPWALVAFGVLAVAALSILSHATIWPSGDAAWFLLIVAGLVVLVARRRERGERPRVLRAVLIVLGSLVALALVTSAIVASIFSVHLRNGVGDKSYHPASYAGLDHTYSLGIGSMRLDLADVEFPKGETRVDAHAGIGDIEIVVPANVSVHVAANAEVGQVHVFDRTDDGRDSAVTARDDIGAGDRVLVLDAHVGAGKIDVSRAGA